MEKRGLYLYGSHESKQALLDEIDKREGRWSELFCDHASQWHGHRSLTGFLDTVLSFTPFEVVKSVAVRLAESIPVGNADSIEEEYENIVNNSWAMVYNTVQYCMDETKDSILSTKRWLEGHYGKMSLDAFFQTVSETEQLNNRVAEILKYIKAVQYPQEAAAVYQLAHKVAFLMSPEYFQEVSQKLRDFALGAFAPVSCSS